MAQNDDDDDDDNDNYDAPRSAEVDFAWCVGVSGAIFSVVVVAHVLRASGLAPGSA